MKPGEKAEDCERPPKPANRVDDRSIRTPANLVNATDWIEVFNEDTLQGWRGGLIQVTGTLVDSPDKGTTYQYALIEVRIHGWVGQTPNVLRRGVLGGDGGPIVQIIEDIQAFTRVSVEARRIVDGVPSTDTEISPTMCAVNVIARFNRI